MRSRKFAALLLAGSGLLFSSCNEKNGPEYPVSSATWGEEFVAELASVRGEAETRTYNVPVYEVRWSEGDRICVKDAKGNHADYALKEGADTMRGVFHIDGDNSVFPYGAIEAFSPASLGETMIWPSSVTESDAMPMYGRMDAGNDTDEVLKLVSLGSVVRLVFTPKDQDVTLQRITLSADQPLSGAFTVDADGKAILAAGADGSITFDFGAEGKVLASSNEYSFYFYVPAGDYTNLKATFTAAAGNPLVCNLGSKTLHHNTLEKFSMTGDFTYTVTFDTRGLAKEGTIPAAQHVISGGLVTEPDSPEAERDKYTGQRNIIFAGWYKDENRTEPWDFDKDKVTGSITLYAKWYRIEPHDNPATIYGKQLLDMTNDCLEIGYLLIQKDPQTDIMAYGSGGVWLYAFGGITITSKERDVVFTEVKIIGETVIETDQDDWDVTFGCATWSDEKGRDSVTFIGNVDIFNHFELKYYRILEEL